MAGEKVPLTFRIYKGSQFIREEQLSLSVIKLGKVPSAHLKLDDESVSRMHAIIEVNGPADVSIIDLGSAKGTFVNGQKVNKAKLQTGDTIVVGETRIELAIGGVVVPDDEATKVQAPFQRDLIASSPAASPPPTIPPSLDSLTPRVSGASMPPPMIPATIPPPLSAIGPGTIPPALPPRPAPISSPPSTVRPPPGLPGGNLAPYGTATASAAGFQQAMAGEADEPGGAQAVEVVAMLGDSVVGVKHCIDPKGGKVSSTTWAMFGLGALALVATVITFWIGVANAAEYKRRYDEQTTKYHVPPGKVRQNILPDVVDWVAFGGLIAALITLTSAVARMRKEQETPWVRIGDAPDVQFAAEGTSLPSFPLVEPHGDDFAFNFDRGMEGEMVVGGQSTSLAELVAQGRTSISPIPANAKIRVRAGNATFLVSSVRRPRRYGAPTFTVEKPFAYSLSGTSGAAIILMLILSQFAVEDSSANIDLAAREDTATRTSSSSQEEPAPPPPDDQADGKDESGGTGTAMALDEGKMGKKDSDRAEGQYKMQKNQEDPQLARQQAIEQARTAGILGEAALVQGGAFASLTGTGDISSGFDDTNIYGGLLGNEAGEMNGGFGFGRSGFGPGGGGTGWGTIGTGRYGTIGHGAGTGSGYGVGSGRGGMRGRTSAVPTVTISQPDVQGDLDKAIIRRYIKRNIQKISYCYEKQLLAKPSLAGTVQAQFFISPTGSVTSSQGSGLDPEVAGCVADVIRGIEFPKPKGGGGVQVNYPFNFRPAGQ